jgi:5-methylcytosine-specific restriction endonuclease McrA
MSRHHRAGKHTTKSPAIRAKLQAMLPLPCVECSRPVMPEDSWHVAHIVPASQGGQTTVSNTGPAHAGCNLKAGGRLGAATVNARKTAEVQGRRKW